MLIANILSWIPLREGVEILINYQIQNGHTRSIKTEVFDIHF